MSLPHAVIIAGGQGTRLGGVRKADLRVGGLRQLDRVIRALDGVQRPIMIANGSKGQRLTLPGDCVLVPDRDSPGAGPLSGLIAAVARLAEAGITHGLLVSVAVDTGFLPDDFVPRLTHGLGDAMAVHAAWGDDFYPPNALWRLEALQHLPTASDSAKGPASLKALHGQLGGQRVDWAGTARRNPFASINTMTDLLALQRRARD
tara:strand:- start:12344 stop:12955 length:612 start_codon:yes stop_codon:yes gene_type:complete